VISYFVDGNTAYFEQYCFVRVSSFYTEDVARKARRENSGLIPKIRKNP
jgi:hypothetical protein